MESASEEIFITRKDIVDFKMLATWRLNLRSQ
jgi:hypothetical protein